VDRIHELKAFVAVAEAGSLSAAAHIAGDSQFSVSKAIGSREKRLGVALFKRSARRVTLTWARGQ
jgi:DNA-binding transcriptional LysR family regulator